MIKRSPPRTSSLSPRMEHSPFASKGIDSPFIGHETRRAGRSKQLVTGTSRLKAKDCQVSKVESRNRRIGRRSSKSGVSPAKYYSPAYSLQQGTSLLNRDIMLVMILLYEGYLVHKWVEVPTLTTNLPTNFHSITNPLAFATYATMNSVSTTPVMVSPAHPCVCTMSKGLQTYFSSHDLLLVSICFEPYYVFMICSCMLQFVSLLCLRLPVLLRTCLAH